MRLRLGQSDHGSPLRLARSADPLRMNLLSGVVRFGRVAPLGAAAGLFLLALALVAIFAAQIAPYDPLAATLTATRQPPSLAHPMGTDDLGRDVLSRAIHGARISLFVGIVAVLVGDLIGLIWGIGSGYAGGRIDLVGQRALDTLLAFPSLILAMLLLASVGAGLGTVLVAIAITMIPRSGRIIRSQVLVTKAYPFIEAARSIGASPVRIMVREIAPQTIAPFLVIITANLGTAIVAEASLSFLGVGVPPPTPSWGNMLGGSLAQSFKPMWWSVVFPGLLLTL
ncbi:MAG: ABC transporter permease, partial [Chloroflexi bacterium]|nr:ABC transporter permease [Chloroflexota bacterium]